MKKGRFTATVIAMLMLGTASVCTRCNINDDIDRDAGIIRECGRDTGRTS